MPAGRRRSAARCSSSPTASSRSMASFRSP
jgi:hypothetical protein